MTSPCEIWRHMTALKDRNETLNAVKGLCMLCVILTHFAWWDSVKLRFLGPFWNDMAIPMFLVISGYLFSWSFERHGITTLDRAYSLGEIIPRLLRFAIPVALLAPLDMWIMFRGSPWPRHEVIGQLLIGSGGPGGYYVPVLLQTVLLMPLVYFFILRRGRWALVWIFLINVAFEFFKTTAQMPVSVYRLLVFRYLLLIAFGAYLAIHRKDRLSRSDWGLLILLGCVGAKFIVATRYHGLSVPWLLLWPKTCVFAILFLLPIAAFVLRTGLSWRWPPIFKPLEIVGASSFEIYIVQRMFFSDMWGRHGHGFFQEPDGRTVLAFSVCLLAGWLYWCVEREFTSCVCRRVRNWMA